MNYIGYTVGDIPYIDVISSIHFCGKSLKDKTAPKSGVSVLPNYHMYLQIIGILTVRLVVILMMETSSLSSSESV